MLEGHQTNEVQNDRPFETDWISGCMTLIPRTTFEIVGGHDESFFIWSDEWDLSLRVSQSGKRLLVVPQSKIYHKVGKSLGVLETTLLLLRHAQSTALETKTLATCTSFSIFIVVFAQ